MQKKHKLLLLSLLFDGIGMLSFVVPGIGELSDVVWAPIGAILMLKMYPGTAGKIGSIIEFIEEIGIFGTDILPTFTLLWFYEFYIKKGRINSTFIKF